MRRGRRGGGRTDGWTVTQKCLEEENLSNEEEKCWNKMKMNMKKKMKMIQFQKNTHNKHTNRQKRRKRRRRGLALRLTNFSN